MEFSPSSIGYEEGEHTGERSAMLRRRRYQQEVQPTVMSSAAMHSLPPVSVRIPIGDQYAMGIAQPDPELRVPDPTIFQRVNGTIQLGQTVDDKRQAQLSLRQRLLDSGMY